MNTVLSARPASVSLRAACAALALPRASLYRHQARPPRPAHATPGTASNPLPQAAIRPAANNALTTQEQADVLEMLNSPRFANPPPAEVYATLLTEGTYLCSVSTMYRLLRAHRQTGERRPQRPPQRHAMPRLRATRPNEVWTWDITKLPTWQRGVYLCLYAVLDLFSRFVVAWRVSRKENSALAKQLFQEASARYPIASGQLTLHQDRGAPMIARGDLDLMAELTITCSHSRPRVSNDNPFSESQFKTLKQQPDYPGRFESAAQARQWGADYVDWYHFHHHHSGLAYFTPEQVFTGPGGRGRPSASTGLAGGLRSPS
jgi:putative transposase